MKEEKALWLRETRVRIDSMLECIPAVHPRLQTLVQTIDYEVYKIYDHVYIIAITN